MARPQKIKLIAGKWKGSILRVQEAKGLRPTPSRARETLFNWLSCDLYQMRCLDLFAGTGALGFEALSRGAAHVTMVESQRICFNALKETACKFKLSNSPALDVCQMDALRFLKKSVLGFDVIFLDPPFDSPLLEQCISILSQQGVLKKKTIIYIEKSPTTRIDFPLAWHKQKQKILGDVEMILFHVHLAHDNDREQEV